MMTKTRADLLTEDEIKKMVEACESGQKRATKAEESPNKRQGRMLEYITFEDSGSQASEEEPIAKIHIKNALG